MNLRRITYRKKEMIGRNMNIKVNENLYSKNIVLKTCYTFIDSYYIAIDKEQDYFIISITAKDSECDNNISGEFWNELLEQKCKAIVSSESKNVRELILTRALYSTYIDMAKDEDVHTEQQYNLEDIAKDRFENE